MSVYVVWCLVLNIFVVVQAGHFSKVSTEHERKLSKTPIATISVSPEDTDPQIVSCLGPKDEQTKSYLTALRPYVESVEYGYRSQRANAASGTFLLPGDVVQRADKQLLVVGYHATGDQHLQKFLKKGIVPVPEKKKVYKGGQFGDGFYVTNKQDTAASYNFKQSVKLVLVIAVEDFCTMTGISRSSEEYETSVERTGNPNDWKNVWIDNKHLVKHLLRDYDYIYGVEQLKFNRRAYRKLHIVGYYHQVPRPSPDVIGTSADCFELQAVNPERLPEMCWEYVST